MASSPRARSIAAPMVSPSTNWRPISFIARPTAVRTTGSPTRRIRPRSAAAGRPGSSSSTRPVISRPQVAALTRLEVERPRCAPQFDGSILSAISSSMVSASGTRSSASARHISPTPSSDDRPYSARKASITVGDERRRTSSTSPAARSTIAARSAADSPVPAASARTRPASSAKVRARIAARGSAGVAESGMARLSVRTGAAATARSQQDQVVAQRGETADALDAQHRADAEVEDCVLSLQAPVLSQDLPRASPFGQDACEP